MFRDIFGYGTISFPVPSGIHEIALFKNLSFAFMGSFWASVPGALVILAVAFVVNYNAIKKIKIAEAVFKEDAEKVLADWVNQARESKIPQLQKMAMTVLACRRGIL